MKELDFNLATTEEIIKELSQRAKKKRKQNIKHYGDQKDFAKHIGMTHRRYQNFEISGKITLEKFIDVLRGLDALGEIQKLLEPTDEDLFKEDKRGKISSVKDNKSLEKASKENNDETINIPDVFSL